MPYTKIWIHLIWSTKNRERIITKEIKPLLLAHIKENAKNKGIHIDVVNCVQDHIHLVASLGRDQTIGKLVQLIKGESSNWCNKQKILQTKFEWQDEYIVVSVSHSMINKVREYINNQEEHHKRKSFMEEYEDFKNKYGFESIAVKAE
ncbi:MAG: IS200/IS605 family transposase [Ignavibacteriales bacterium]|nr:IS200/IS605 family transposase [Ignavibacteriales bacterium]